MGLFPCKSCSSQLSAYGLFVGFPCKFHRRSLLPCLLNVHHTRCCLRSRHVCFSHRLVRFRHRLRVAEIVLTINSVLGKCECGYSVKGQSTYTDAFEADFFHQDDIANDRDWDVSRYPQNYDDSTSMQYSLDNVISRPLSRSLVEPGLQLFVRGHTGSGAVGTAELVTRRKDMHYGSYRAAIKSTAVSGTCGSMFWVGHISVLSL